MNEKRKKTATPLRKKQNGVLVLTLLVLAGIVTYANVRGLVNSYYDSFVRVGEESAEAVSYLEGLTTLGLDETQLERMTELETDWDSWKNSRLRDELTVVAEDGTVLHGYLFDENSSVTAIAVPRFGQDGTSDFLLGPWLNEQTGCNILLLDPRAHGESGGESFTYGYWESKDLLCWMDRVEETLGEQTFLLWGEASGANTILFAAASGALDGRVACIVAESPFASLRDLAEYTLKNSYGLPDGFFRSLLESKFNRSDFGFRSDALELGDALENAEYSVPVLYLISEQDTYVLPEMTESVFAKANGNEYAVIRGGWSHGTVYADCRNEILTQLEGWLN